MWGQGAGWQGEEERAGWWRKEAAEGEVEQMVDLYIGMQEL